MTNMEWLIKVHKQYVKDLIVGDMALKKDGDIAECDLLPCSECKFSGIGKCGIEMDEWLDKEHIYCDGIEEFASTLNVDDVVFVRHNTTAPWNKCYFVKFQDGILYASRDRSDWGKRTNKRIRRWNYVKLPEKYEVRND